MKIRAVSTAVSLIGACLLMIEYPAQAQTTSPIWAPPALERIIEEGMSENKDLQSLAAKVESLRDEISFAGSLDDPRLGIGVINLPTNSFSFQQEPMTQKQLFAAQKIPWFGKLSLKAQKQALMAARQQAILEAKRFELARKIAVTFYELGFISTSLEINGRLTDMVSQVLKVAETRYTSGKGLQQDVLQAQVELSKLLDEKITLEKKLHVLQDSINELLNREGFLPIPPPKDLPAPEMKLELKALQNESLGRNPMLAVKKAEIDLAEVGVKLARKDYWPDVDFMLAYGQREEDSTGRSLPDFFSASMVLNIPLWQKNRQDKNLAAKQKEKQSARKSFEHLLSILPHQVDAMVTDILQTQENYRLFSSALVLQAEQWAKSSLAAYVVDQVEFNTMINAQIRLLNFELMAKKYLFEVYKKRAELEELLGGPVGIKKVKQD